MKSLKSLILVMIMVSCTLFFVSCKEEDTPPVDTTITISFVSNGGSEVPSATYKSGEAIVTPASPTREGYSFMGWYSDATLYYKFYFNEDPKTDITLYAKWYANSYTIIFNSLGGTLVPSVKLSYGANVSAPTPPTRVGATLLGWYTKNGTVSGAWGEKFEFNTPMPAIGMNLYARWELIDYTINFNSNGGTIVESMVTHYNYVIEAPAEPVKDNSVIFVGWYTQNGITSGNWGNLFVFDKMAPNDITLYAKWDTAYYINFDSLGGTEVSYIRGLAGSSVTSPVAPTRESYENFLGWYTRNGSLNGDWGTLYSFNKMASYDVTLYAKWGFKSYSVTLYSNDGFSGYSTSWFPYSSDVSLNAPNRTGYIFQGWYTQNGDAVGDWGSEYVPGLMPAENFALYAKWEIGTFTISFDSKGGTPMDSLTGEYNTYLRYINEYKPEISADAVFSGWYTSDGTETQNWGFKFESQFMPGKDTLLYARWLSTVTFETNFGTSVSTLTTPHGLINLPVPSKASKKFVGWYDKNGIDDGDWGNRFNARLTTDITLYARYESLTPVGHFTIMASSFLYTFATINKYNGNSSTVVMPLEYYFSIISAYRDLRGIVEESFKDKTNTEYVFLNGNANYIQTNSFWGCTKLKEINVPKEISISSNAFRGCGDIIICTNAKNASELGSWINNLSGLGAQSVTVYYNQYIYT